MIEPRGQSESSHEEIFLNWNSADLMNEIYLVFVESYQGFACI